MKSIVYDIITKDHHDDNHNDHHYNGKSTSTLGQRLKCPLRDNFEPWYVLREEDEEEKEYV